MSERPKVLEKYLSKKTLTREEANASSFEFWKWNNSPEGNPEKYPDEEVVRFIMGVRKKLKPNAKEGKILDLGCGSGKNLGVIAEAGMQAYGVDWSLPGLELIRKRFEEKHLKADLKMADFTKDNLPYDDDFFDAIVAIQIFDHLLDSDSKNLLSETKRVLKPGGQILLSLMSDKTSKKTRTGIPVEGEALTEVVSSGNSAGEIHRFFTYPSMEELLTPFFQIVSSNLVTVRSDQTGEVAEAKYFVLERID